jgi:hypothetical protein
LDADFLAVFLPPRLAADLRPVDFLPAVFREAVFRVVLFLVVLLRLDVLRVALAFPSSYPWRLKISGAGYRTRAASDA